MNAYRRPSSAPVAAPLPAVSPPPLQLAAALAALLIIQSTALGPLGIPPAAVSLVLVLVLWFAIRFGARRGFLFAMIAGACEDALSGHTGAAWTFATATVGALAGRVAQTPLAESLAWTAPIVMVATLLRYLVFALLLRVEGITLGTPSAHLEAILWQSVVNAAVAIVFFVVARRFSDHVETR